VVVPVPEVDPAPVVVEELPPALVLPDDVLGPPTLPASPVLAPVEPPVELVPLFAGPRPSDSKAHPTAKAAMPKPHTRAPNITAR
jgi:hypothetical protein